MVDNRESIYLDTISLASDYPNRKSMSLSRQTIYHSAEDLNNGASHNPSMVNITINGGGGGDDTSDYATPVSKISRYSTTAERLAEKIAAAAEGVELRNGSSSNYTGGSDEVSARLLYYDNVDKKMTVTYSQWKSRTWRLFQDGERSVDYVLAYYGDDPNSKNMERRKIFEQNLENEGLQLEREQTQRIHFVKIHAPREVLFRYSEILQIKMPIKKFSEQEGILESEFELVKTIKTFLGKPFDFVDLDRKLFPEVDYKILHHYSKHRSYLFDTESKDFFTQRTRIQVVHFILERQRFSDEDESTNNFGIEKLLEDCAYQAAYPLHDGDCNLPDSERGLLYTEWAAVNKWIKHQPLDNIKEYFGVKVALYFAWLGFYTHMLIPAAVIGIICFLYGLFSLFSNSISEDICSPNNTIIMCPQCDQHCDFWRLKETCIYSRFSHLFDNNTTVAFACLMSLWAVLYLELWKRYSAKLIHRWGMTDFSHEAEHPRPQYLSRLKKAEKKKFNVIHRVLEPHVPFWKVKFPIYLISYSIVFLFMCLAVGTVFGITIYRMSVITSRSMYGEPSSVTYQIMVLPATAAIINLIVITALNFVYDYLAVYLTDLEYRRTQTEYHESVTLKIYLFQFVNYYSSIFYIAFLKGKFIGQPSKYNRIFGFRQEECSPGGCLMELCIQLVIIMVGKQAVNALMEMLIPFIIKTINTVRSRVGLKDADAEGHQSLISCNQWTNDYKLLPWTSRALFNEYLEMIIQYGFVTLFVVAFPLAPLFALLNNIFEMRLDAKKFLQYYRRPIPTRVKDIGVWYNIMAVLGRLAVVSSAFIIAFSSNFIPRLVYIYSVNKPNYNDTGYLNHTLAYFRVKDFRNGTMPLNSSFGDVDICRYSEYRNPPWSDHPYKRPMVYWQILAARLIFLVLFQNVVGLFQMIVAWAIPDVPRKIRDQIKREEYLTREIIIREEKRKMDVKTAAERFAQAINTDPRVNNNSGSGENINLYPLAEESDNNFRRRKQNGDIEIENTIL